MGKEKYVKDIENLFEKSPVIDFSSIERAIKSKKNVKQYAKQLVRNFLKKGKIKRLTKGFYTRYNENSLAVFCFKPAYLGLQDALSFHNLWEQETIPVIITTRKIRQGIREVFGGNILIKRIEKKSFFGFDYFKEGDFYLPYSDIEKTFIDMVYFKENISKEALRNIKNKIDKKKLQKYLKKYPKRFRDKAAKKLAL
jgi:predicted transcriptional regulator of viral defense system